MATQFRNLSSSQLASYTPLAAEPVYNRDTGELIIGDGTTTGGTIVGGGTGGSGYSGYSGYSGSTGGVTCIVAGSNVTISPTNGLGVVTINSTGGGGGGATGATGFSGVSGVSGFSGISGYSGQGLSGFSGLGATGATGVSGLAGDRYSTTSSTSLAIASSGTITLTVTIGLAYSAAQSVIIANNGSNYMTGTVDTYNSGTGVMTVIVTASTGSGTYSSWSVNLAGAVGAVGATGVTGATGVGSPGATGVDARKYVTVYLYQWATTQPSNPTGSSVWTWSPAGNASYSASDGWSVVVGSNPGGPTIKLWVASKTIDDVSTATTTSVDWTISPSVYAYSTNGAIGATGVSGFSGIPGLKTANVVVYRWSLPPAPSISGTSTYTWSSQSLDTVPTGWSAGIVMTTVGTSSGTNQVQVNTTTALLENGGVIFSDAIGGLVAGQTYYVKSIVNSTNFTVSSTVGGPTLALTTTSVVTSATSVPISGYTLWSATVSLQAAYDTLTSSVDWTTAQILSISYAAANGASSRVAYTRIPGNPSPGAAQITISGDNLPLQAQSALSVSSISKTTVGSSSGTNQIQVNSTTGLVANVGITFSAAIGGLVANKIYYIKTIVDGANFTVSSTSGGETLSLSTTTVVTTATQSPGWGLNYAWYDSDPNPSSTDSLFQTYGVFNGTDTIWDTPFLASLRVGQLSAITTNTGTLTVNSGGYIQVGTGGYIKVGDNPTVSGSTMTGSGGVINGSTNGEFAFGNSTANMSFNGTTLTINGNLIATGNLNTNSVTVLESATTSLALLNPFQSLIFAKSAAPVIVMATGTLNLSVPANTTWVGMIEVYRDTSVLYQQEFIAPNGDPDIALSVKVPFSAIIEDTIGAGSYTYTIQFSGSGVTATMSFASLTLLEVKR